MSEYKKHFVGEIVKGTAAALVGALILWGSQKWLINEIEYQRVNKDSYLSATLGQQGLTMAYDGKPLKNVSVVEFGIVNRTARQFNDVELVFSVDDPKSSPRLVSGGIITLGGLPQSEVVEELKTAAPLAKKYRIKVIPKRSSSRHYQAVFVFDGEKAPQMSIVGLSKDAPVIEYQSWRDNIIALLILIGLLLLGFATLTLFSTFVDHFVDPKRHKREVEKFQTLSAELKAKGKLNSHDPEALVDARTIFASYTRPKRSRFWSKILGEQRYEY